MRSSIKSAVHEAKLSMALNETPGLTRIIGLLDDVTKTIGTLISKKGKC